jgi:hypothetical protein
MLTAKRPTSLHVDHPAWQAALRAPIEPETDDEREAVAAAMASGVLIPGAQIAARSYRALTCSPWVDLPRRLTREIRPSKGHGAPLVCKREPRGSGDR